MHDAFPWVSGGGVAPLNGNVAHDDSDTSEGPTCADGEAMVGLGYGTFTAPTFTFPRIVAVTPICANITTWDAGSTVRQKPPVMGRTDVGVTTAADVLCPTGTFVVGHPFYQSSGREGLVGIKLMCRGF